jgi:carbon monoxide dehydrogenase subunit G
MIITDSFDVAAPLETVWALFNDVPRVATCIPNAKVTEAVDETTYKAEIGLKVGPVSVSYKATIVIEKIDNATHDLELKVRGNEAKGRGDVSARVAAHVEAQGAKTHVTLTTDASMTGVIATVGGRLIEGVAKMTTAKFAANLAALAAVDA